MMHRRLPGDNKLDPVEFLDITSKLGFEALHELAAVYLDVKYAALLSSPSGDEMTKYSLARAQGVREFVRWIQETRDEVRSAMENRRKG